LNQLISWLIYNGVQSEQKQHFLFNSRKICNVWRKHAFESLILSKSPADTYEHKTNFVSRFRTTLDLTESKDKIIEEVMDAAGKVEMQAHTTSALYKFCNTPFSCSRYEARDLVIDYVLNLPSNVKCYAWGAMDFYLLHGCIESLNARLLELEDGDARAAGQAVKDCLCDLVQELSCEGIEVHLDLLRASMEKSNDIVHSNTASVLAGQSPDKNPSGITLLDCLKIFFEEVDHKVSASMLPRDNLEKVLSDLYKKNKQFIGPESENECSKVLAAVKTLILSSSMLNGQNLDRFYILDICIP
jgi:hypothetical protein